MLFNTRIIFSFDLSFLFLTPSLSSKMCKVLPFLLEFILSDKPPLPAPNSMYVKSSESEPNSSRIF